MRWEYKTETCTADDEATLNAAGQDGWELTAATPIVHNPAFVRLWLKRPLLYELDFKRPVPPVRLTNA